MAGVIQRGTKWYVQWKTAEGWHQRAVTTAKTKAEAKRFAAELEQKAERQRYGLEPRSPPDGGGTVDELLEWWLRTYSKYSPSHSRNESTVRTHLIRSSLGGLRLSAVTAGKIEVLLQAKASELSPQSLNHIRRFLLTAFNRAKAADRWPGANPAATVRRRPVPKRAPEYLRTHEVPALLAAIDPAWRALYATAIFTGLRKGELLGLRKVHVDLRARLLTVPASYDRTTTKGGRAEVIPIAEECVPFLRVAMETAPSDLVFSRPDGSMYRPDIKLEDKLRRAMGRAGITTGYLHACRKKGCRWKELVADAGLRRCPSHGTMLWPKAQVRKLRFHDLRHTTASLLMMAGANPAAVQRIMRHSDPRITTETYGHLAPEYLRSEVDRLRFNVAPPPLSRSSAKNLIAEV